MKPYKNSDGEPYTCTEGRYQDPGSHSNVWLSIESGWGVGKVCSNHLHYWTRAGWKVTPFISLCREALGQTSGSTSASQVQEQ